MDALDHCSLACSELSNILSHEQCKDCGRVPLNTISKWEDIKLAQLQSFKAELFKALSHPTRIRILELLRDDEKSVSQLQLDLGTEGSTVSQQLAILRMKNLVDTRRAGTTIYYRLRDPQISDLLNAARRIFEAHVIELQSMTEEDAAAIAQASQRSTRPRRVGILSSSSGRGGPATRTVGRLTTFKGP